MEPAPEGRKPRVRKPLSDCTNTITTTTAAASSQSSSASTSTLKRLNPKLSSVTKTLFRNLNSKPSAPPPPIPSTPSRPPPASSFASGTSDFEAVEPCSVYTRRPSAVKRMSAVKRKNEGKENAAPLSCPPAPKIRSFGGKTKEKEHSSLSKKSKAPPKKKQHAIPTGKNVSEHALPQDFIEKQRAYFAEIDAFELLEEEVDVAETDDAFELPEKKVDSVD